MNLTWMPLTIVVAIGCLCVAFHGQRVYAVGVNWGTQASHPLSAQTVVQMLKVNNITKVKLFNPDNTLLRAMQGTNIEVMVGLPNDLLITVTDSAQAEQWVQNNVLRYISAGTKIRYVAVGNEPFLKSYNGTYITYTLPALRNIQQSLINNNMGGQVKATVPLNADILSTTSYPSQTVFRSDIATYVVQIVNYLSQNGCPFTVNMYPFLSVYNDKNFPILYAIFDTNATPVTDGQYTYHNVFDASYDSLLVALSKVGHSNMSIIVGEIGWPTDGDVNANTNYAQKFNQGFIDHLVSNSGTPRRPKTSINAYLFSLIDEDKKSIAPGNFERHWGIFKYDGKPKYTLSLTGSSDSKALVAATGVQYLKQQWCVLTNNTVDTSTLPDSISYACVNSDCTSLGYGCSCHQYLDANGNASYAFNSYFQRQDQQEGACNFNGLGMIVNTNPSINNCQFIIQISPKSSSPPTKDYQKNGIAILLSMVLLFSPVLL